MELIKDGKDEIVLLYVLLYVHDEATQNPKQLKLPTGDRYQLQSQLGYNISNSDRNHHMLHQSRFPASANQISSKHANLTENEVKQRQRSYENNTG